jgi:hypothetical protein
MTTQTAIPPLRTSEGFREPGCYRKTEFGCVPMTSGANSSQAEAEGKELSGRDVEDLTVRPLWWRANGTG